MCASQNRSLSGDADAAHYTACFSFSLNSVLLSSLEMVVEWVDTNSLLVDVMTERSGPKHSFIHFFFFLSTFFLGRL